MAVSSSMASRSRGGDSANFEMLRAEHRYEVELYVDSVSALCQRTLREFKVVHLL